MTPEDIRSALNSILADKVILNWWQLGLLILATGFAAYFGSYLKKKGENLATKEDVAALTRQLESVKAEIAEQQSVRAARHRLKYEACLKALSLIDAVFSHHLLDPGGKPLSKQYATTKEARECHSMLILSCESTELIVKFAELVFGTTDKLKAAKPLTDVLNDFRNLIREELGFGRELELDRERAWFGKIGCEEIKINML